MVFLYNKSIFISQLIIPSRFSLCICKCVHVYVSICMFITNWLCTVSLVSYLANSCILYTICYVYSVSSSRHAQQVNTCTLNCPVLHPLFTHYSFVCVYTCNYSLFNCLLCIPLHEQQHITYWDHVLEILAHGLSTILNLGLGFGVWFTGLFIKTTINYCN